MSTQLSIGQVLSVHGYKHNGDLYRSWDKSKVLEITSEILVLVNESVTITEINGRKWTTYDPAIWLFFPNQWYNIICMLREDGIHYYCNIASPFLYENGIVKYIDYDLDIKVFPNRKYRLLDLKEFNINCKKWKYHADLQSILWKNFNYLKKSIKRPNDYLFNNEIIHSYWLKFKKINNAEK